MTIKKMPGRETPPGILNFLGLTQSNYVLNGKNLTKDKSKLFNFSVRPFFMRIG